MWKPDMMKNKDEKNCVHPKISKKKHQSRETKTITAIIITISSSST